MGMGEKPRNYIQKQRNKGKNPPFGCPPIPHVYKIEGRLFSGAKRTENKPDLP